MTSNDSDSIRKQMQSGYVFKNGPFNLSLKTNESNVVEAFTKLYPASQSIGESEFIDFHITIQCPSVLRRFYRPQIQFVLDGISPFKPLPRHESFPLFEWGLNWCVATHAHQYFMLHAAVLEKNGLAVIMPAPPGSGKSTLCAEMAFSGWRLLSDEFALINHNTLTLTPFVRPISLKNASIDIVTQRHSDAVVGSIVHNTSKGSVAHLRPLDKWFSRQDETAIPKWVIFPRYQPAAKIATSKLTKAHGMMNIISNSFNYAELGSLGFKLAERLTEICDFYDLTYSNLDEAMDFFNTLSASAEGK